jgi:hypothetical protein
MDRESSERRAKMEISPRSEDSIPSDEEYEES